MKGLRERLLADVQAGLIRYDTTAELAVRYGVAARQLLPVLQSLLGTETVKGTFMCIEAEVAPHRGRGVAVGGKTPVKFIWVTQ